MRIQGTGPIEQIERVANGGATSSSSQVDPSGGAPVVVSISAHHEAPRAEKIAALKQAVDSGSYQVDKDKLASKIVDDELARGVK